MAPLRTAATACGLLLAFALLTYTGNASAAQLGGRRSLQTWVPESGSFTLETGLVHPNPVKSKTEVTWDHNAKPPPPAEKSSPPPPPPAESPAPEEKQLKGKQIEASFNKEINLQAQVTKPFGEKEVLIKEKPSVAVSVNMDKGTVKNEAASSPPPPPEKETVYVIEKGHDSPCGCHDCACGH